MTKVQELQSQQTNSNQISHDQSYNFQGKSQVRVFGPPVSLWTIIVINIYVPNYNQKQRGDLISKSDFERWAATLGVKINRYHEENVIFSEEAFRS